MRDRGYITPKQIERGGSIPVRLMQQLAASVIQKITVVGRGRARLIGQSITIEIDNQTAGVASRLPFLAKITKSTATLADKKWDYDFEEVFFLAAGGVDILPNGRTGTAINGLELAHTAASDVVWAVDTTSGGDYPAGFKPQPIPVDSVVTMLEVADDANKLIYIFSVMGNHDGTCEAP